MSMNETTSINILVENRVETPGLLAEHGLAYLIQRRGRRIMFDTGQGKALLNNAFRLGVSLPSIETIVLSHGHYDHAGGLADVLRGDCQKTVYAHPAAIKPKFASKSDGTSREIGIPYSCQKALDKSSVRIIATLHPTEIGEGIYVTGPVPRPTDFEDVGGDFFLDRTCRTPDSIEDDQSIYFDTADGIVVLLGCAHSGIIIRYDTSPN